MAEILAQQEKLECLLSVCLYCKDYRSDSMFWEEASRFFFSSSETDEVHPDDFLGRSADAASPLHSKGSGDYQEGKTGNNRTLMNEFFIVSNRGCLFGEHDHDQRL